MTVNKMSSEASKIATDQGKVAKARETEIARRLALIFDRLPLIALHSFLQNLNDGVDTAANYDKGNRIPPYRHFNARQWQTAEAISRLQFPEPLAVVVEVTPSNKDSRDRFDLVIPIPAILIGGKLATSLIFEFKLGAHDPAQLKKYSVLSPNSIVISIELGAVQTAVTKGDLGLPIVLQNWEHLYYALQSMLSGDAQPRVVPVEEPDDLLLNFDHRVAGQDRLAFEIESFLQLIIDRGLLPNRNLVLVVPRGTNAAETLSSASPYYRHPDSWESGYRYLVVIYGNTIQNIYKVTESVTTDHVDGLLPPSPKGIEADWQDIASAGGSRVSMLEADLILEQRYKGKKYVSHGPKGGARAFTMSHRYVQHPDLLANYFKETLLNE